MSAQPAFSVVPPDLVRAVARRGAYPGRAVRRRQGTRAGHPPAGDRRVDPGGGLRGVGGRLRGLGPRVRAARRHLARHRRFLLARARDERPARTGERAG